MDWNEIGAYRASQEAVLSVFLPKIDFRSKDGRRGSRRDKRAGPQCTLNKPIFCPNNGETLAHQKARYKITTITEDEIVMTALFPLSLLGGKLIFKLDRHKEYFILNEIIEMGFNNVFIGKNLDVVLNIYHPQDAPHLLQVQAPAPWLTLPGGSPGSPQILPGSHWHRCL